MDIEDILIFQCKIEFYFTEWTQKEVFSRVAVATSENQVVVSMSEIEIQCYTKTLICFFYDLQ